MENQSALGQSGGPVTGIPGLGLLPPRQEKVLPAQSEQTVEAAQPPAQSSEDAKPFEILQSAIPAHEAITSLKHETKVDSPPESPSLISALEASLEGHVAAETKPESTNISAAAPEVMTGGDVISSVTEGQKGADTAMIAEIVSEGNTVSSEGQNGADTVMVDAPMADSAEAEFEADSSPYESSSDDSSDDSSSSDDDDAYPLLTPEEQARILMQDDGGSDDEGAKKASGGYVRTKNEAPEEVIPKPDVTVTPEMKIVELGVVESVVENIALIKAKTSGEYQVLESNSVLCLEDRSVIGVVSDTLGPVQQPLYCVRFTNPTEIAAAGVAVGTKIFYVETHSTYVFTQALKGMKGTDASNLWDEEVGDQDIEFSDDEKEMEHKRRVKEQKRDKRNGNNNGEAGDRKKKWQENKNNSNVGLSYDDIDGPYKPLSRPASFAENYMRPEAPQEDESGRSYQQSHLEQRNYSNNAQNSGRGGGRGRGDRGRGGRGRGSDRGGYQNNNQTGFSLPPRPQNPLPPAPAVPHYHPFPGYPPQQYPQASAFQPSWPQNTYLPGGFAFQGMQSQPQAQYPQIPGLGHQQLPAGAFVNPAFFGAQALPQNQPQMPNQWNSPPQPPQGGQNGQNGSGT